MPQAVLPGSCLSACFKRLVLTEAPFAWCQYTQTACGRNPWTFAPPPLAVTEWPGRSVVSFVATAERRNR